MKLNSQKSLAKTPAKELLWALGEFVEDIRSQEYVKYLAVIFSPSQLSGHIRK